MSKRRAPARATTRQAVSYKDSDTETTDESDVFEVTTTTVRSSQATKKRPAATSSRQVKPNKRSRKPRQASHKQADSPKTTSHTKSQLINNPVVSDGVVPDWSALPYEILLTIFRYASAPIRDDDFSATPQTIWPLRTACVCRAFREPALATFYECPPLQNTTQAHNLLDLLKQNQENLAINYRVKVRRLEFGVRATLAPSSPGRGHIDISEFLDLLPNLLSLEITNETDNTAFIPVQRPRPWSYPRNLLERLRDGTTRLRTWKIHGKLMSSQAKGHLLMARAVTTSNSYEQGTSDNHDQEEHAASQTKVPVWVAVLGSPGFEDLRSLALAKLNLDDNKLALTDAVCQLSNLAKLSIASCQSEEWHIFSKMSQNLQSLDIQRCDSLDAEVVRSYLGDHGRNLQYLNLSHNRSLNLGFLTDLKYTCPNLKILLMDLTYYSTLLSYKDSDPAFKFLLGSDEIPTWPATLERLELIHLRKWSSAAAENLFGSLIESAEDLPFLRTLILKAAIDIGWRDRAGFRETWISRLQMTFLRRYVSPDPCLASARVFRERAGIESKTSPLAEATKIDAAPEKDSDESQLQDEDSTLDSSITSQPTSRRSRRIKDLASEARRASQEPSTPAEETESDTQIVSRRDWKQESAQHFQGLCSVVEVTIDNMRPSEVQFDEGDFLDSERSGDEDWTGDVDGDVEAADARAGYAW